VVVPLDVLRAHLLDPLGEEERLLQRLRGLVFDGGLVLGEPGEHRPICDAGVGRAPQDLATVVGAMPILLAHADVDLATDWRQAHRREDLNLRERRGSCLPRPCREGDAGVDATPFVAQALPRFVTTSSPPISSRTSPPSVQRRTAASSATRNSSRLIFCTQ
jgi:hypothetical protein